LLVALGLAACGPSGTPDTSQTVRAAASGQLTPSGHIAAGDVVPMIALPADAADFVVGKGVELELRLRLPTPDGRTVTDVSDIDVDPFAVRLPGGNIRTVEPGAAGSFRYTFTQPGAAVVSMCARAESWTSCSKSVVTVNGGTPGRMLTDVTAKHGTPVELRPLKDDRFYRVGIELPVRAYLGGKKHKGAEVEAHRPDGSVLVRTANSTGTARFDLDQPGAWVIRFADQKDGHHYLAEIAFSVSEEAR
jgi:hypothetical protein